LLKVFYTTLIISHGPICLVLLYTVKSNRIESELLE